VIAVRLFVCAGIALICGACEPTKPRASGSHAAPARAPTFTSQRSKPIYDQAVQGMRAIDTMRGSPMTEALATDLGFKCADLEQLRKALEPEPDPVVWRLRTDIEKTCKFDVPLASALLEIDRIQKKRAGDPNAGIDGECRALKLAIADLGTGFIGNPVASDVLGKELTYCESSDTVRRVP
jgi:hypothetical protein